MRHCCAIQKLRLLLFIRKSGAVVGQILEKIQKKTAIPNKLTSTSGRQS